MDLRWRTPSRRMPDWWSSTPGQPSRATAPTRRSARCSTRRIGSFLVRCGACRSDGDARRWSTRPTSRPWGPRWPTPRRHGTAVFNASGDTAGLECKGGEDWSTPPGPNDIGVDAVASVPEMTSVGGTTLSTDLAGAVAGGAGLDRRRRCRRAPAGASSTLFARPRIPEGGIGEPGFRAPPGSRYRRGRRPVHGGADRVRTAAQDSAAVPPRPRRSGPR